MTPQSALASVATPVPAAPPPAAPAGAAPSRQRVGVAFAVGAYTIWGLLPLYLMVLKSAPPLELLGHRVVWSIVFVLGVLAATRRWGWIRGVLRSRSILLTSAASATALALNWLLYIWAVNTERNVDASLGYFINPLLSIALGAMVLRERLSRVRWIAVACASAGVLWLIVQLGQVPWIGLGLAVTFGSYGLLRKTAALGALEGLALELAMLLPFAAGLLGWLAFTGHGHVVAQGPRFELLILLLGPVTAVPLLLFAAGARRIPLYLVGLLQYIGPTLQLGAGVLVGHEPFGSTKIVGYAFVWLAFALASTEGLLAARRSNGVAA